jgi:hypothetical protein
MKNVLISSDLNLFSVNQNKATLWLYRLQQLSYFIAFVFVGYLIYTKSDSKTGIKLAVIIALSIPFLIVVFRSKDRLAGKDFCMSGENGRVVINKKVWISEISMDAISVKEMISTYSAQAYYDISIKANRKKYSIAMGVDENDKDEILKGLNYLN